MYRLKEVVSPVVQLEISWIVLSAKFGWCGSIGASKEHDFQSPKDKYNLCKWNIGWREEIPGMDTRGEQEINWI